MTPERDVREAFDNWLTQNSGYAPSFINPDERAFGLKAYAAGHSAALSQGRATTAEGGDALAKAEAWVNAETDYTTAFHKSSSGQIERSARAAQEAKNAFTTALATLQAERDALENACRDSENIACDARNKLYETEAERDAAVAQERKRYERLAVSFGELQGLAQAVIDEVNKKLDHQHPPLKFTAPWAVLAKLQDCLLKNYGLRAAALKGDAKPATEEK